MTYKITKGAWSCLENFPSIEEAQIWADARGPGHIATLALPNEQIPEEDVRMTVDSKTEEDFKFGSYLLQLFVADNRRFEKAYNVTISKEQTEQLIADYKKLIDFCSIGAINELAVELSGITPNAVFTQERKDKYQALVSTYLN